MSDASLRVIRRGEYRVRVLALALAVCCALPLLGAGVSRDETGFPLFRLYTPEEFAAGPQNWAVAQGDDGVMYFGNLSGVLPHAGSWWRTIPIDNDSAVFAVGTNDRGDVLVGGVGELGYVTDDGHGSGRYASLIHLLAPNERDIGEVRQIVARGSRFYANCDRALLLVDGNSIRVLNRWPEHGRQRLIRSRDALYIVNPAIVRIDGTTLTPIVGSEVVTNQEITTLFTLIDGSYLLGLNREGLFVLRDGALQPYALEASSWLKGKEITSGATLRDGRVVVGTRQDGIIILQPDGSLDQLIDTRIGLPDTALRSLAVDREGSLWLALDGAIGRIDVSSPVTLIDARGGLKGMANGVIRHQGNVYVGTNRGLFVLGALPWEHDEHTLASSTVHPVASVSAPTWDFLSDGDRLLVGTSRGIFSLRPDGSAEVIAGSELQADYLLVRSAINPLRIWVGTREGLVALDQVNGQWTYRGVLPDVPRYVRSIEELNGFLWCGTIFDGVTRFRLNPDGSLGESKHFGSGEMKVARLDDRIVIVQRGRPLLQVDPKGSLVPDPTFGKVDVPLSFFAAEQDRAGNVWLNSRPPVMIAHRADGSLEAKARPLPSVAATHVQRINADDEGIVWLSSEKGVYRYRESATPVVSPTTTLIRQVTMGGQQLLPSMSRGEGQGVVLPFNFRRLRIEFASPSFHPGLVYQYRVDNLDTRWSEWTTEPFADFTNLSENHYTFRVRSKSGDGVIGPEGVWSFTVLPPWYRTRWALGLWILLGIGAVALYSAVHTRNLRRQAELLRARVAEQTEELRHTVSRLSAAQSELVRQNELLEQANSRLEDLSLLDELTAIANRRYLEKMMAEEWRRAVRAQHPLSMIMLDLDEFKHLNDTLGHTAGDACLRTVGYALGNAIRRSGDLVARYGGEEFVVLLPNTDAPGALRVAEQLRELIESLAIPRGDRKGVMTASLGVATIVPRQDQSPTLLIELADHALYAAKRDGRNRVGIGPAATVGPASIEA